MPLVKEDGHLEVLNSGTNTKKHKTKATSSNQQLHLSILQIAQKNETQKS